MALAYDATGTAATGTTGSLTWTHTLVSGTNSAVLAAAALDASPDTGITLTATCGGVTMTPLGTVHANGGTVGFAAIFGLAGVTSGAKTIVVTRSTGTGSNFNGGSMSFTGASQATPFGTPATATGSGTTTYTTATGPSLANTSGNLIAGFDVSGNTLASATSPSTSRFLLGGAASNAGSALGGATTPATGSAISMAWTISSADYFGVIQVQVLALTGTSTSPAWAASQNVTAVAGTGSWTSPGNATGTADSVWATWTAP